MYDYDRRRVMADAAPPPKSSVRFKWGYDAVVVSLYVGRQVAGRLLLEYTHPRWLEGKGCEGDIESLAAKGFNAEGFWVVNNVDIKEEFRNKGLGKVIYEAAFTEVAKKKGPIYVGPYSCLGHGTSEAAERVWTSLARKYPASGHVLYVRG